jgi:hypothetical protein
MFIFVLAVATSDTPVKTKGNIEQSQEHVSVTLYPDSVISTIEKLKEPGMSKVDKYSMFEQKLIGLNPTEKEMEQHKKIVTDAYAILSFEDVVKLEESTLLKQIYSARIVDRYYSSNDALNPIGLFAFNYLQIAKDAYRGILEKENYIINKSTMDKHYKNFQ